MSNNLPPLLPQWMLSQLRPVDSATTSGLPVQPQAGQVLPAADYELRPAVYVDHGGI